MRTTNQNGAGTFSEQEPESGTVPQKVQVTPHWNAIGGLVAIGVLYALLPVKISFGPYGLLLLAIEAVFLLPFLIAVMTRRSVSPVTLRVGSLILFGIVTFVIAIGIVNMILTLPKDLKGLGLLETGLLLYGATSSCSLYGIGKSMGEDRKNANSPLINCLTSCFHSRWADLMRTGCHIFLITSMWLLPVQLPLVQPIRCPCHIVRNFS